MGSDNKESACNTGDLGSIPGCGRSPGEGYGDPLHYSCLENSMGGGAWWATVHGVTDSDIANATNTHTREILRVFLQNWGTILQADRLAYEKDMEVTHIEVLKNVQKFHTSEAGERQRR